MRFALTSEEHQSLSKNISDLDSARSELETCLQKYNSLVADAHNFVTSVVERLQEQYNEQPDEWQEGREGEEVGMWIGEWEEVDFTQDVTADLHHSNTLGSLRTECE